MTMYEIKYLGKYGWISTPATFFIACPTEIIKNQWIIDEEKRSGVHVYLKAADKGGYTPVSFSKVQIEDKEIKLQIFAGTERTSDVQVHN